MGRSCCVPGCYNTTRNHPPIKFYTFPTDPHLRQIWVANMDRAKFKKFPFQKEARVCSIHFEDSAFSKYSKRRLNYRLKSNAVPTLFPWPVQHEESSLKLKRVVANQSEDGVSSVQIQSQSQGQSQDQGRDEPNNEDKSIILQDQGHDDKNVILNKEISQDQGRDVWNIPDGSKKLNVPETFACLRNVNESISSNSLKDTVRIKLEPNVKSSGDNEMIDINDYLQRSLRENQTELKTNDTKNSDMVVINEYLQRALRDNNNKNDAPETFSCFQINFNESQFTSEVNLDEFSLIQNSLWENSRKIESRHNPKSLALRRINVKTSQPNPLLKTNVTNSPSRVLRRINIKNRSKKSNYSVKKYQRSLTIPSTSTAVQRHSSFDDVSSRDASNNPERYQCLQTKFKTVPSTSSASLVNFPIDGATSLQNFPIDGATCITKKNSNPLNGIIYSDSNETYYEKRYVKPRRDSSSLEDGPSSLRFYKPNDINRYTGFASFLHLLEFHKFLMPEVGYLKANDSKFNDDETERSLSHIEELIIVLTRLRLNLDENVLSDMYDVSSDYVLNVLLTWIPFLASKLEYIPIYPSRKEVDKATPPIILKAFPHLRLLIDFLDFLVEVSDNSNRFPFKRKKMLKAIIGVSPLGRIVYFSKLISGDVTRDTTLKRSGLLDTLDEGDLILSGIKFNLKEELESRNVALDVPDFLRVPDYLSPRIDKLDATQIMKLHLNKSLKRIREFKIFSNEIAIPCALTPVVDDIFTICCHLANFTQSL